jgi:enoyl-CoA hydratase/carnithine racemase
MFMPDPRVALSWEGPVALITIYRPDKLNALDLDMLASLDDACAEIEGNHAARAAVITGEGKAFSTGGDIKAWSALLPHEFGFDWVRVGNRVFNRMAELRVPLIAALGGHALGGGLELAATADIRIAEPQARLGMPETGLGMVPGWSGTQRLVRRFGAQLVRRMVLGGEVFSGDEALALGLVDDVVDTGHALEAAMAYAARVAERGPAAVQTAKLMIAAASGEAPEMAIDTIASILAAKTADLREGVDAFGSKRPPAFKGEW